MAAQELDSKYDRFFSITTDEYGIDPLKDRIVPNLMLIQSFTPHTVSQAERGAPDLIAYNEYGSDKLWWVILAYNGISSYKDVLQGLDIRIPALADVVSAITDNAVSSSNTTQRVITI
jgi:hypothetical protein